MRGRISPSAPLLALAATGVAVIVLVAFALTRTHTRIRAPRHASATGARTTHSARPRARAVSRRQLVRARSAARRFLAGYLRFAYGEAAASSVRAVAPRLRRQLKDRRALIAPAERLRHPRVISLVATGPQRGVILATALVDDGGIANYAVSVTLRKTRSRWLVSAVDDG